MTSRDLARYRDLLGDDGVEEHAALALAGSEFGVTLRPGDGAALAAVRRRTGLAVGFTASIGICFVYYFVIRAGQAFGYNGDLSPLFAAWLGNIIFGTLSLFFLARARH